MVRSLKAHAFRALADDVHAPTGLKVSEMIGLRMNRTDDELYHQRSCSCKLLSRAYHLQS